MRTGLTKVKNVKEVKHRHLIGQTQCHPYFILFFVSKINEKKKNMNKFANFILILEKHTLFKF